ncbi:MAG: hypothetical protein ACKOCH_11315, partial [Bacteroidota bacterium]
HVHDQGNRSNILKGCEDEEVPEPDIRGCAPVSPGHSAPATGPSAPRCAFAYGIFAELGVAETGWTTAANAA